MQKSRGGNRRRGEEKNPCRLSIPVRRIYAHTRS